MKKPTLCVTKFCRNPRGRNQSQLCKKCQMRRWRANRPLSARLAKLRDRAAQKKLPFDLDIAWLTDFLTQNNYNPAVHHIDRICVLGGYTKGNLQLLDGSDNIAKGNRERYGQAWMY